jgi:hypothetical protein
VLKQAMLEHRYGLALELMLFRGYSSKSLALDYS